MAPVENLTMTLCNLSTRDEKNSKYRGVAEQNGFEFMPFVFSHNGQIHPETVSLICRQIEAKLMLVDGKVSKSEKESIWKLWVHHVSVTINKTAVEMSDVKLQKPSTLLTQIRDGLLLQTSAKKSFRQPRSAPKSLTITISTSK